MEPLGGVAADDVCRTALRVFERIAIAAQRRGRHGHGKAAGELEQLASCQVHAENLHPQEGGPKGPPLRTFLQRCVRSYSARPYVSRAITATSPAGIL